MLSLLAMNDIAQEASSESPLSMWATGSCLDSDTAAGECYLSNRAFSSLMVRSIRRVRLEIASVMTVSRIAKEGEGAPAVVVKILT